MKMKIPMRYQLHYQIVKTQSLITYCINMLIGERIFVKLSWKATWQY